MGFLVEGWPHERSPCLAWNLVSPFFLVTIGALDSLIPWPSPTWCHPFPPAMFAFLGPELLLGKLWKSADLNHSILLCYQLSHFSSALTHRHTGCFQTNHSIWPPSSSQRTSPASLMRLLSFNCPIDTLLPFRPIPGTEGLSLSVLRRHSSPDLWTWTPLAYLPPRTSSSTLTSVPKSSSVCLLAYRTRVLSVMTSPSSLTTCST